MSGPSRAIWKRTRWSVVALIVTALTACGSDPNASLLSGLASDPKTAPVTGYQEASAFSPLGHSVAGLADGRVRVTATGSPTTPIARLQKIALARASEYGSAERRKFFQASAPVPSIRCGERQHTERGVTKKLPARGYNVVEIDVTYSDTASDPTFVVTKATAAQLKAELLADQVAPDAAAAAAVVAQCGA